jgi:hypothetical protein
MTDLITRSASTLIKELQAFSHEISSQDRIWKILFPTQNGQWHYLHITQYQDTFYISHINGEDSLEVIPGKAIKATNGFGQDLGYLSNEALWETLFSDARKWLKTVNRDWIKANKRMVTEYPLRQRYGMVPNALVRASLSDIYRLDLELGKGRTKKLVKLIEDGTFRTSKTTERTSMSANDFFEYCRIAYIAAQRKDDHVDPSLTGREMYERHADGRHEGLLDIDPASEQEFAEWIDGTHPKRDRGGHPWEIKRGGNTTHINLAVSRPSYSKEGFKVELRGESIGRMEETMKMVLAIQAAGLPIGIADPEGVRKRLLAQDNIGIVPAYQSLHRANQRFHRDQSVYDVMHYDDLSRYKRRITPFITWEPLPILRPRN